MRSPRRLRNLLALALAALVLPSVNGCANDIQTGIDRATDLLYRKQYVEAERLYRKLLKRLEDTGRLAEAENQQRLAVLDRLGKINALYLHDYSQAITDYRALVANYPKEELALAARAAVADIYKHKLGDLPAAIEEYQKLVEEFPTHSQTPRAQLRVAECYLQLKNYEQARTEAEVVVNRWPESIEAQQARFKIANAYSVQDRYAEAIATYEGLLEDEPDFELAALVLFELGNCFEELGETDRALDYYYACLRDHPNPNLVQRTLKRVRARHRRTRPSASIHLPAYLQRRLAMAASAPPRARVATKPRPEPAATPRASVTQPDSAPTEPVTTEPKIPSPANPEPNSAPAPEVTPATETPTPAVESAPPPAPKEPPGE